MAPKNGETQTESVNADTGQGDDAWRQVDNSRAQQFLKRYQMARDAGHSSFDFEGKTISLHQITIPLPGFSDIESTQQVLWDLVQNGTLTGAEAAQKEELARAA